MMTRDSIISIFEEMADAYPDQKVKGKSMPYLSLNGNMFGFISKENQLVLRLSKEDRAAFLSSFEGSEIFQHGVLMKDYVAVPTSLLEDKEGLAGCFEKCWTNATSLKPKPSKKK